MIQALLGIKIKQTQIFDDAGRRRAVTVIEVGPCTVSQIKNMDTDGYTAVQLGLGTKKDHTIAKPQRGHYRKAGLKTAPRFLREVRVQEDIAHEETIRLGDVISVDQVFSKGDTVTVTGTSKGKGFTGVMKRWGFSGGPATHGQSDRDRAPGSIGGGTTPGRVYKGKKMAGRSGSDTVTVKGLKVLSVEKEKNELVVQGLIPGPCKGLLIIERTAPVFRQAQATAEEKIAGNKDADTKNKENEKDSNIKEAS